jgi:hypothetical protein
MSDAKKDKRAGTLARIRALMAMTTENGCTEAEARTAAAALDRLMATYEIDLDEVTLKEQAIVPRIVATGRSHAVDRAAIKIGTFTDCLVWSCPQGLTYLGFQVDTEIAEYLTLLFKRALDREAVNFTLFNQDYDAESGSGKADMLYSFKVGMAMRLGERLDELKSKRDFTQRTTGRDLVAIKMPLVNEAMKALGIILGKASAGRSVRNMNSFHSGKAAANKVAISQGIASRGETRGRLR